MGSDTPSEAYWAGNELLAYYEAVNNIKLNIRFDGGYTNHDNGDWVESNYEEVIEKIKQL